jgi:UDP-GlcNAc:undecaprenyl-phosphate GlcNAc-1-phosphate transferase
MYDYDVILSFITAFTLTYFAIPSVVHIAKIKNLTDEPGERRSHTESTPSLGGIAIFAGTLFAIMLWTPFATYGGDLQYILCSFIIIFLIGAKDDIDPISPTKKLVGEILAAAILVFKSDVILKEGLADIFGVTTVPLFVSVVVTIFTILVIINAFNLIDGINGLSGSIATLIAGTLGTWFLLIQRYDMAIVAFSLAGAVVAFLKYNYTPAKIFMGDTGALLIGLVCSILTIRFIELDYQLEPGHPFKINAAPAVGIGILILPLFDTLRVFITRILNGKSPLYPDRNHIHHLLIDSGLSHMQATFVLVVVNFIFIVTVFLLQKYTDTLLLILLITGIAVLMMGGFYVSVVRRRKKLKAKL